jgi:serine/threonine protein phosphatase PrpC
VVALWGIGDLSLIWWLLGVLAVTRALGDSYMKELVTGHPYTTESVLQAETDEFIILACDGVYIPNIPDREVFANS